MLRYAALNSEFKTVLTKIAQRGERIIADYAKENVSSPSRVDAVERTTKIMLDALPAGSMCALKFTSFGSREHPNAATRKVQGIVEHAKERDIKVCLDAEDVLYPQMCYDLMLQNNTREEPWVYTTYQMYRMNALRELREDLEKARRDGICAGVKLVRGAYLKKQAGVFDRKADTDRQYDEAIVHALSCQNAHTVVATHNEHSLRLAHKFPIDRYVTAQLMGMGGASKVDYRYVPYGTLFELTPYLLRRLAERMSWS